MFDTFGHSITQFPLPSYVHAMMMMQMHSVIFAFLCITVFDAFSKQIHASRLFVRSPVHSFYWASYIQPEEIQKIHHKVFDIWTVRYANRWLAYTIHIQMIYDVQISEFRFFSDKISVTLITWNRFRNAYKCSIFWGGRKRYWPIELSNKIFLHEKFNNKI